MRTFVLYGCYNIITFVGEGLVESHGGLAHRNAAFSLLLPGKVLYFKALNSSSQRKFRDKGNKPGARQAWELLQENGLGKLKETKPNRGTDFVSTNFIRDCVILDS